MDALRRSVKGERAASGSSAAVARHTAGKARKSGRRHVTARLDEATYSLSLLQLSGSRRRTLTSFPISRPSTRASGRLLHRTCLLLTQSEHPRSHSFSRVHRWCIRTIRMRGALCISCWRTSEFFMRLSFWCFLALLTCLGKGDRNCLFTTLNPTALATFRFAPLITVHLVFHFSACTPRIFSSHEIFSTSSET